MPKPSTFPTLFDDCKTVSISILKKHGYLELNQQKSGTITWSRGGNKTGSISIIVNTVSRFPYVALDYACNGESQKYRVELVTIPSNLGKGHIWYFLCPFTLERCRKLYLIGGKFSHRKACRGGGMYEVQAQSKKYRHLNTYFKSEQLHEQLYKKHFKRQYAGKPTKRFLKLHKQLKKAEVIPHSIIEQALIR